MTGLAASLPDILAELIYSHVRYDVISYFQSAFIEVRKRPKISFSDGLGSNISGVEFRLPYQLAVFLLFVWKSHLLVGWLNAVLTSLLDTNSNAMTIAALAVSLAG